MSNPLEDAREFDFDFDAHRRMAIEQYTAVFDDYELLNAALTTLLKSWLQDLYLHSVAGRTKSIKSFGDKAITRDKDNPDLPKYLDPIVQITDKSGIRIITYFKDTLEKVDAIIQQELEIVEKSDKGELLVEKGEMGYQSVHYLVRLSSPRREMAEHRLYKDLITEIQVRTILQHAWAEIEHDIQYKSVTALTRGTKRRFIALAGMLEIADREFQSIQEEFRQSLKATQEAISTSRYADLEITYDSLNAYLEQKFPDVPPSSEEGIEFEVEALKRMGLDSIAQVDAAVTAVDGNRLYAVRESGRNRNTRLNIHLLAALGEAFIENYPSPLRTNATDTVKDKLREVLRELHAAGIPTGTFRIE